MQSLFTARKHRRLGTKSRGSPWAPAVTRRSQSSTTIHGNTLLQDNKYTKQYAIHSIYDGCNFLSGTRACISQIVCSSHFPNYDLYKALRLGNKEGQGATPLEVKQSFCWRWEDYWQRQTRDCGKFGEIRKLAFALVTSKGHIYDVFLPTNLYSWIWYVLLHENKNTNAKRSQIAASPNNFANEPLIALKSRYQTALLLLCRTADRNGSANGGVRGVTQHLVAATQSSTQLL